LLISTENDSTIEHSEVLKMHTSNPHLFKLISYNKKSPIQHDKIQRTPLDLEVNAPKEWSNPYFDQILLEIEKTWDY
jgi:hypothetical protein